MNIVETPLNKVAFRKFGVGWWKGAINSINFFFREQKICILLASTEIHFRAPITLGVFVWLTSINSYAC